MDDRAARAASDGALETARGGHVSSVMRSLPPLHRGGGRCWAVRSGFNPLTGCTVFKFTASFPFGSGAV
jgi:hypothetical protein